MNTKIHDLELTGESIKDVTGGVVALRYLATSVAQPELQLAATSVQAAPATQLAKLEAQLKG